MKNSIHFIVLTIFLFSLSSCDKLRDKRNGIHFKPDHYSISAAGGVVYTTIPKNKFMLEGSRKYPINYEKDPYYSAKNDWTLIETDFFTAELMPEFRIKFTVQPNTTGKVRAHCIAVWRFDYSGFLYLTQTAE